jgi:hypothetical protein
VKSEKGVRGAEVARKLNYRRAGAAPLPAGIRCPAGLSRAAANAALEPDFPRHFLWKARHV